MTTELIPVAGTWYVDTDREQTFEVLSVNEDDDAIELQYEDGSKETLDFNAWHTLDIDYAKTDEDDEEWEDALEEDEEDDVDDDFDDDMDDDEDYN